MRSAALIGLITLAACGGPKLVYEGPRMEPNEIARITIDEGTISPEERFKAKLVTFDGVPARRTYKEIEVLPGEHTLQVAWQQFRGLDEIAAGSIPMKFELRAGYAYTLFWIGGEQPLRFRERPIGP